MLNAFAAYRWLVFKSAGSMWAEFLRFNLTYVGTLAWGLGALTLCVEVFGLSPLWSQALVTIVAVVLSYLGHKHFSFSRR